MNSDGKMSLFFDRCSFVQMSINAAMSDPYTFSEYDEFIDEIRSVLVATLPLSEEKISK